MSRCGEIVAAAVATARESSAAEDARPLVDGTVGPGWDEEPDETYVSVYANFAPALGEAMARAGKESRWLYGFADHEVVTLYVGSSTGLRLRQVAAARATSPRTASRTTGASRPGSAPRRTTSATSTRIAIDTELTRRLGWATRTVSVEAGRHPTVMPPAAVADLMTHLY